MQSDQRLWQAFIVAHQAAKAGRPGEGALDHPATGQEHEALTGLGQLDDLQTQVVGGGLFGQVCFSTSRIVNKLDRMCWLLASFAKSVHNESCGETDLAKV